MVPEQPDLVRVTFEEPFQPDAFGGSILLVWFFLLFARLVVFYEYLFIQAFLLEKSLLSIFSATLSSGPF